jgi:tRNA threonylcarbamoyladenosine biosynthesis protein TsaE
VHHYTLSQIAQAAQIIISKLQAGDCIALSGEMGAGKTSLIAAMCQLLQVADHVSSPTYSIINEYNGILNGEACLIAHMDWYRLESEEELIDAGVGVYLNNPNCICFVEWSERAPQLLPAGTKYYQIDLVSENERVLKSMD